MFGRVERFPSTNGAFLTSEKFPASDKERHVTAKSNCASDRFIRQNSIVSFKGSGKRPHVTISPRDGRFERSRDFSLSKQLTSPTGGTWFLFFFPPNCTLWLRFSESKMNDAAAVFLRTLKWREKRKVMRKNLNKITHVDIQMSRLPRGRQWQSFRFTFLSQRPSS